MTSGVDSLGVAYVSEPVVIASVRPQAVNEISENLFTVNSYCTNDLERFGTDLL
jgi:hypothetical protein